MAGQLVLRGCEEGCRRPFWGVRRLEWGGTRPCRFIYAGATPPEVAKYADKGVVANANSAPKTMWRSNSALGCKSLFTRRRHRSRKRPAAHSATSLTGAKCPGPPGVLTDGVPRLAVRSAVVFWGAPNFGVLLAVVHRSTHQVGKLIGKVGVESGSGRAACCPRRLPSCRSWVRGCPFPGLAGWRVTGVLTAQVGVGGAPDTLPWHRSLCQRGGIPPVVNRQGAQGMTINVG